MTGLVILTTWRSDSQTWKTGSLASRYIIGQAIVNLKDADDCMLIGTSYDIECNESSDIDYLAKL